MSSNTAESIVWSKMAYKSGVKNAVLLILLLVMITITLTISFSHISCQLKLKEMEKCCNQNHFQQHSLSPLTGPMESQLYQTIAATLQSDPTATGSTTAIHLGKTSAEFPVRVIDNCVDLSTTNDVVDLLHHTGLTYGWDSNKDIGFGHWNVVFGGRNKLNRNNVEEDIPDLLHRIWKQIQPTFLPDDPVLVRCYANSHTYGVEGYPHTDTNWVGDKTAVLYLNSRWLREWGGETSFFQGNDVFMSVMPRRGRLVVFNSSLVHVAR